MRSPKNSPPNRSGVPATAKVITEVETVEIKIADNLHTLRCVSGSRAHLRTPSANIISFLETRSPSSSPPLCCPSTSSVRSSTSPHKRGSGTTQSTLSEEVEEEAKASRPSPLYPGRVSLMPRPNHNTKLESPRSRPSFAVKSILSSFTFYRRRNNGPGRSSSENSQSSGTGSQDNVGSDTTPEPFEDNDIDCEVKSLFPVAPPSTPRDSRSKMEFFPAMENIHQVELIDAVTAALENLETKKPGVWGRVRRWVRSEGSWRHADRDCGCEDGDGGKRCGLRLNGGGVYSGSAGDEEHDADDEGGSSAGSDDNESADSNKSGYANKNSCTAELANKDAEGNAIKATTKDDEQHYHHLEVHHEQATESDVNADDSDEESTDPSAIEEADASPIRLLYDPFADIRPIPAPKRNSRGSSPESTENHCSSNRSITSLLPLLLPKRGRPALPDNGLTSVETGRNARIVTTPTPFPRVPTPSLATALTTTRRASPATVCCGGSGKNAVNRSTNIWSIYTAIAGTSSKKPSRHSEGSNKFKTKVKETRHAFSMRDLTTRTPAPTAETLAIATRTVTPTSSHGGSIESKISGTLSMWTAVMNSSSRKLGNKTVSPNKTEMEAKQTGTTKQMTRRAFSMRNLQASTAVTAVSSIATSGTTAAGTMATDVSGMIFQRHGARKQAVSQRLASRVMSGAVGLYSQYVKMVEGMAAGGVARKIEEDRRRETT